MKCFGNCLPSPFHPVCDGWVAGSLIKTSVIFKSWTWTKNKMEKNTGCYISIQIVLQQMGMWKCCLTAIKCVNVWQQAPNLSLLCMGSHVNHTFQQCQQCGTICGSWCVCFSHVDWVGTGWFSWVTLCCTLKIHLPQNHFSSTFNTPMLRLTL